MSAPNLLTLPAFVDDGLFRVVIESPRGSIIKLKYDPEHAVMTLSGPLVAGLSYPYDWGFVPSTRGPDGDPVDVFVMWDGVSFPGVVLPCRPLGVLRVEQSNPASGKRERNDRVAAIPTTAPRLDAVQSVFDVGERIRLELEQFFLASVAFEGKELSLLGKKCEHSRLARTLHFASRFQSKGHSQRIMAFRLQPDEPVARGLRRLVKKELRAAHDELATTTPPSDESIHEVRKSVKKVRALLQTIKAADGTGLDAAARRLRRVNRTLSHLRDADAMVEVLTKLRKRDPRLLSEHTFARVRRELSTGKRQWKQEAEREGAWKDIDRDLRTLRRRAKRWRPSAGGFDALAPGIRLTYREGRKAMRRARKKESSDDFHEWRKQMKALWYQLRLLETCHARIAKHVRALRRGESLLGDEHNVVVLCQELSRKDSPCADAIDLDRLRLAADRFQCSLRNQAIAKVGWIYARKAGNFVRTIKRVWKAWRRQARDATRSVAA